MGQVSDVSAAFILANIPESKKVIDLHEIKEVETG